VGHERAIERLKEVAAASKHKNEFFLMHISTKAVVAVINPRNGADEVLT
jgi:hypothetical protein